MSSGLPRGGKRTDQRLVQHDEAGGFAHHMVECREFIETMFDPQGSGGGGGTGRPLAMGGIGRLPANVQQPDCRQGEKQHADQMRHGHEARFVGLQVGPRTGCLPGQHGRIRFSGGGHR